MKLLPLFFVTVVVTTLTPAATIAAEPRPIPDELKGWEEWSTWNDRHRDCPTPFDKADEHLCFWPGRLTVKADADAGSWELTVKVFGETWVPLPGDADVWPLDVAAAGAELPVVEHDGQPAVKLTAGDYQLSGVFRWQEMPQMIAIPREIGVLALVLEGDAVEIPNWDKEGRLWLRRLRAEGTDKDQLSAQVYRLIEDGIPLWLRTEIELRVSGKSREEELGWVLPAGWKLSQVESQLPVAVDDAGRAKAQVRAGKWAIRLHAFRTTDADEFRFDPAAQPAVDRELVAFKAEPEFRMAEVEGLRAVDVSQTTFPGKWAKFPVFEWETSATFRLAEKMRGMGLRRPEGLRIERELWLDEDGRGVTFSDTIRGTMQQIWRLDIAAGQELGAVRANGDGQLITANPATGAHGVEIRSRDLNLEAIGRSAHLGGLAASGWQTDVDGLHARLHLPPGWRLFALFGADEVDGDWLTAWTLLDLFLLLVFSAAVFRLWGWQAGVLAFAAFGLAYHEIDAPRYTWLFLLAPVALLRVVPPGAGRKWVLAWKYLAAAVLLLILVPFIAGQIQSVIYPQLERHGMVATFSGADNAMPASQTVEANAAYEEVAKSVRGLKRGAKKSSWKGGAKIQTSNLLYDPKARIQTGPAKPDWAWRMVQLNWSGPVAKEQTIHPMLISLALQRVLTVLQVGLLIGLAALLFGVRRIKLPFGSAALVLLLAMAAMPARAEVPDAPTLQTLRERLIEPADAFPRAAEIPTVTLKVDGSKVTTEATIHAAVDVAVPLPGRLPSWSPISVQVDGKEAAAVRRKDGFLWVVLPAGVHRVEVQGLLPGSTEWEWSFKLKPRRVTVDAPGWTVTGLRPNGVPESQVFLARQRQAEAGEAAYDRRDFNAVVALERHLEVGLEWQMRSKIVRLSAPGKAVSLRVPLLPGEKVITSNATIEDGFIEVGLGAGDAEYAWDSVMPRGEAIALRAAEEQSWIERWYLVTSPVWNVALDGLAPVFEPQQKDLVPVWRPWPGEAVTLTFSKPEPIPGETITVKNVQHQTELGRRQRTVKLDLALECSLGGDFVVGLEPATDVASLKHDGRAVPVRRETGNLIVPVRPGAQRLEIECRSAGRMGFATRVEPVSLPVEGANVKTVMRVPESRWVLWANGPLRGPAVRFWTVLACAVLAALVLGSLRQSPLKRFEWVLLAVGLTQVPVALSLVVVIWFFLLGWRGGDRALRPWVFNLLQLFLVALTLGALGVLFAVVGAGLLGDPAMFIRGNGSSAAALRWFEPRPGMELPQPMILSVSIWFYRLLMLAWALWLATALIGWLRWAWGQFGVGGYWRRGEKKRKRGTPPPVPGGGN